MTKITLRRGDADAWDLADTVLLEGEIGYETDTGRIKIGDGSTAWTSLGYQAPKITQSLTAPEGPIDGDIWYKTDTGKTYVYFDSYWIEASSGSTGVTDASVSQTGLVNTTAQSFAGNKTFTGRVRAAINKVQTTTITRATFNSTVTWTTLMSVTITTYGNPVLLSVTGDLDLSVDSWARLRITRDGTNAVGGMTVADNTASGQNIPFAVSVFDDPAAGTYTYSFQGLIGGAAATGTIGNVSGVNPTLWAWEVGA